MPEALVVAVVLATALSSVLAVRYRRDRRAEDRPHEADIGRRVLVGVAHPASAEALGGLAATMSKVARGRVEAVCVLEEGAADLAPMAEEAVARCGTAVVDGGVEASKRVRVDASIGRGVLHHAVEFDATLVVLGWPGAGDTGVPSGVEPAIRDLPAPLLLARLQGYPWERIRLHVAGAPTEDGLNASMRLASQVAERLARAHDVPVTRPVGSGDADPRPEAVDAVAALTVLPVAPRQDAVRAALREAPQLGDLILALCHGPAAREHRPLLLAAEQLYDVAASSRSS